MKYIDIHQSPLYIRFMERIGWKVEKIESTQLFIKQFPLIGSVIKLQRPTKIPSFEKLKELQKKHRAFSFTIEPLKEYPISNFKFPISNSPYLPTKTIHIDLTPSEQTIFNRFSEAKRRAVRRALKNNVVVQESTDIESFIKLKSQHFFPFGFLVTREIKPLWETFAPNHATLLLAYSSRHPELVSGSLRCRNKFGMTCTSPLAGILLLFWDHVAYYWLATSSNEGNQMFAPTLLVWEALKLAKRKKCKVFDFEGIYDERYPNLNKNWHGFTRFKQGFNGTMIYYPPPFTI